MTTRLYLANQAPTFTPATIRGTWSDTTGAIAMKLSPTKTGANTTQAATETSATLNWDVLLGRWICDANVITGPGNVAGSIIANLACLQSATAATMCLHWYVYVTVGSTDVVRTVLVNNNIDGNKWPTATAVINQSVGTAAGQTAVAVGDRIVAEIGYQAQNAVTTAYTGTIRYGGTASDLTNVAASTVGVTTDSPWIEFADTNGVLAAPVNYTQAPNDTALASDAATAALTYTRTAADTAAGTDTVVALPIKNVGPDPAAGTDAATVVQTMFRAPADRAVITEQVVATLGHTEIIDYQFVLGVEPWMPFGYGQTVVVENFDPGTAETRDQDGLSPVADVRWFGQDLKTPPTWSFDLYTDVETADQALGWAANFERVWDLEAVRTTPNMVIPLRYAIAGRLRRVYGRPRNFAMVPTYVRTGRVSMLADFVLAENTFYDDALNTTLARLRPSTRAGLTFPLTFPATFQVPGVPRQEVITVGGTRPTWVDLTFYGSVQDPWVQIGQQRWALRGTLPLGQSVRMSGAPWQQGLLRSDGAWVPGMLDPRARLSQLRLAPGQYTVTMGGFGDTSTARTEVSWRDAYGAM